MWKSVSPDVSGANVSRVATVSAPFECKPYLNGTTTAAGAYTRSLFSST
jgi:hypothetical protein